MERRSQAGDGYLDGHLIVAMPGMDDPRFERAVIYVCAHSPDGAMGIRINQAAPRLTFPDVLSRLQIMPEGDIRLPPDVSKLMVHRGGPVETGRGFVLHSADYVIDNSTLLIDDDVCLTATLEILKAIASGRGPKRALLALGYAGWGPGQLEAELQANGWLPCPARPDLVFSDDLDDIYDVALAEIGVDPAMLSSFGGRA
jgi:putative transcriptional regulator